MTQRFDELYISRGEHQEIIAYYQRLVAHMFQKMKTMEEPDGSKPASGLSTGDIVPAQKSDEPARQRMVFGNVVRVDFRQRRS